MQEEFQGAIGIDLGTTYSCVAVFLHNSVEVIPNDQGNRTTPSRVAFHNGQLLVGDAAMNLSARGAPGVVYDSKRLIGREFQDPSVQADMQAWPFTVVPSARGRAAIRVEHHGQTMDLEPQQISAHILSYLKECAERHLGKIVRRAVITVPAYFNDSQRQSTRDAGAIAGLEVLRIINEPTAAALCYGLGVGTALGAQGTDGAKNVLVFDFGGGTFDVSIITIDCGTFEVRSTAGDTHLGGQDIDQNLMKFFVEDIRKRHQLDVSTNAKIKAKLRSIAEKAKRALSHSTSEEVSGDGMLGGDDYVVQLSRAKFDELNAPVYERCMSIVKRAMSDAKMKTTDIDEIVMVGGSSRIPKLREMVSQMFHNKSLCTSVNPDEAIAIGAAVQASILSTAPEQQSDRTAGVVLMDVVSLSIGLDVDDGQFDVLIPRNTTIPYSTTKEFSTTYHNQTEVEIEVFEGERPLTKHNRKLGSFVLDGITKARKGVPSIVITLSVDANGCLTVTATESTAKKTKALVVDCKDRLSAEDVQRMIDEASKMRGADTAEAARLQLTHEVGTSLRELDDRIRSLMPRLKEKHAQKLAKRTAFVEQADKWLIEHAPSCDPETVRAKVSKIWALIYKTQGTLKRFEEKAKKHARRKRRRDSDDDDEADEGEGEGQGEDNDEDDDGSAAGSSSGDDEDDS